MNIRRYPGAKPFTKDQQAIFYGREEDIERLYRMISLEPLSVLYGKSGYGKSSLINAGLVPKLDQDSNNLPILIRFQAWTKNSLESPLDRIQSLLKELPLQRKALDKLSPKENSLWYLAKAYQYAHPDHRLILLFDQFEELFSYPKEEILEFKKQLAELVRGQLPDRYDELLDIAADREEAPLTEEEEEQLYSPLNVRINFSIRSDRMHLLDQLSDYLPNVLLNNLELKALKEEDAVKALVFPAQMPGDFDATPFSYTEGATKKIMRFLKNKEDGLIEAIQLQILCTSFEDKAIQENIQNFDIDTIGDLDAIIKNFYHDQLAKIENEHDQKAAARLLEDGLLDKDRKERLTLHESQIWLLFRVKSDLLNQLVDSNLLRREPDRRIGYTYELSHDTLIAPALAAREIREQEEAEKQLLLQEQELKEERRKRRNTYAFAVFASILAIFASLATFQAWKKQKEAEEHQDMAYELSSQVAQQLLITQVARDSAKAQKDRAELETLRAELETLRADSLLKVAQDQEALALLEAAKGNKLKKTLSGGNVYKYLKNQGTSFYNKGEYRSALTYWANAQFFLDTAIHENPLIISGLIRKAKLGTLAEDDFQNGRLTNAKKRYRQLKADNYLNKEPIEKRLAQIDTSLAVWKRAIGDQKLDTIQVLEIEGDIAIIPQEAKKLKELKRLIFKNNKEDVTYLNAISSNIDSLIFEDIDYPELPDISKFKRLKYLKIARASRMGSLPEYLEGFTSLSHLQINEIANLSTLFSFDDLKKLQALEILDSDKLIELPSFDGLINLEDLLVYGNNQLRELPSLDQLKRLEKLEISSNYLITELPSLNQVTALIELNISNNFELKKLPSFNQQRILETFTFHNNDKVEELPSFANLNNLLELNIYGNETLKEIPSLKSQSKLENLSISNNPIINSLPSFSSLKKLEHLVISNNFKIVMIPALDQLENLKILDVNHNNKLSKLPALEQLKKLQKLSISSNMELSEFPDLSSEMDSLRFIRISGSIFRKNNKLFPQPIVQLPASIGELPALEELNLSVLKLTELPASFENLKNTLKLLNIRYNPMSETVFERWKSLLPETSIRFGELPEEKEKK